MHLVSECAEDLNLSFVVDQSSADVIVSKMHSCVFEVKGHISNSDNKSSGNMEDILGSTWTR